MIRKMLFLTSIGTRHNLISSAAAAGFKRKKTMEKRHFSLGSWLVWLFWLLASHHFSSSTCQESGDPSEVRSIAYQWSPQPPPQQLSQWNDQVQVASNYYNDNDYDQFYPSYEFNPGASTTSTQKVSTQRVERPLSAVDPQYYSYYSGGPTGSKSPQYTTSGSRGSALSSTMASVKSAVSSVLNKVKRFRRPVKNNNNRISNLIDSPIDRLSGFITQTGINRQINAIGGTNIIFFLTSIAIGLGSYVGFLNLNGQLTSQGTRISNLESQIASLNSQNILVRTQISGLRSTTSVLGNRLANINREMNGIQPDQMGSLFTTPDTVDMAGVDPEGMVLDSSAAFNGSFEIGALAFATQDDLKKVEMKADDNSQRIDNLEDSLGSLSNRAIAELEAKIQEFMNKVQQGQDRQDEKISDIAQKIDDIEDMNVERINVISDEILKLKAEGSGKTELVDDLGTKLVNLTKNLETIQREQEIKMREFEELKMDIDTVESRIEESILNGETITTIQRELGEQQNAIDRTKMELQELITQSNIMCTDKHESLLANLTNLELSFQVVESMLQSNLASTCNDFKQSHESLKSNVTRLEELILEVSEITPNVTELETSVDDLKAMLIGELVEIQEALLEYQSGLAANVTTLEMSLKAMQMDLESKLEASDDAIRMNVTNLDDTVQTIKDMLLETLQSNDQISSQQHQILETNVTHLQNSLIEIQNMLQLELNMNQETLQANVTTLEETLDKIKVMILEALSQKEEHILGSQNDLRANVTALEGSLKDLYEMLQSKVNSNHQGLQSNVTTLQTTIENIHMTLLNTLASNNENTLEEYDNLKGNVTALEQGLAEVQGMLDNQIGTTQDTLQSNVSDLEMKLQQIKDMLSLTIQNNIETSIGNHESLRANVTHLETSLSEIHGLLQNQLQLTEENITSNVKDLESTVEEIQQMLLEALQMNKQDAQLQHEELISNITSITETVDGVKAMVLDGLQTNHEDAMQKHESLKSNVTTLEMSVDQIRQMFEAGLEASHEMADQKHMGLVSNITNLQTTIVNIQEVLQEKLAQAQDSLRSNVSTLENTVDEIKQMLLETLQNNVESSSLQHENLKTNVSALEMNLQEIHEMLKNDLTDAQSNLSSNVTDLGETVNQIKDMLLMALQQHQVSHFEQHQSLRNNVTVLESGLDDIRDMLIEGLSVAEQGNLEKHESLKSNVSNVEAMIMDIKALLTEGLNKTMNAASDNSFILKANVTNLSELIMTVKTDLQDSIQNTRNTLAVENEILHSNVSNLNDNLTAFKAMLSEGIMDTQDQILESHSTLKANVSELEMIVSEFSKMFQSELMQNHESFVENYDSLKSNVSNVEAIVQTLQLGQMLNTEKSGQLQREQELMNATVEGIQEKIMDLMMTNVEQGQGYQDLRERVDELELAVVNLEDKTDGATGQFQEEISNVGQDLEQLETFVMALNTSGGLLDMMQDMIKANLSQVNNLISEVQAEIVDQGVTQKSLEDRQESVISSLRDLGMALAIIESSVSAHTDHNAATNQMLMAIKSTAEELEARVEALDNVTLQVETLDQGQANLEESLDDLRNFVAGIQQDVGQQKELHEALNEDHLSLKTNVTQLESQVADLQQIDLAQIEQNNEVNEKLMNLMNNLNNVNNLVTSFQLNDFPNITNTLSQLRGDLTNLGSVVEEEMLGSDESKTLLDELRSKAELLMSQLSDLSSTSATKTELNDAKEDHNTAISSLRAIVDENSMNITEVSTLLGEFILVAEETLTTKNIFFQQVLRIDSIFGLINDLQGSTAKNFTLIRAEYDTIAPQLVDLVQFKTDSQTQLNQFNTELTALGGFRVTVGNTLKQLRDQSQNMCVTLSQFTDLKGAVDTSLGRRWFLQDFQQIAPPVCVV